MEDQEQHEGREANGKPSYDFDAPQRADFADDDNNDQRMNADGYFVERIQPSSDNGGRGQSESAVVLLAEEETEEMASSSSVVAFNTRKRRSARQSILPSEVEAALPNSNKQAAASEENDAARLHSTRSTRSSSSRRGSRQSILPSIAKRDAEGEMLRQQPLPAETMMESPVVQEQIVDDEEVIYQAEPVRLTEVEQEELKQFQVELEQQASLPLVSSSVPEEPLMAPKEGIDAIVADAEESSREDFFGSLSASQPIVSEESAPAVETFFPEDDSNYKMMVVDEEREAATREVVVHDRMVMAVSEEDFDVEAMRYESEYDKPTSSINLTNELVQAPQAPSMTLSMGLHQRRPVYSTRNIRMSDPSSVVALSGKRALPPPRTIPNSRLSVGAAKPLGGRRGAGSSPSELDPRVPRQVNVPQSMKLDLSRSMLTTAEHQMGMEPPEYQSRAAQKLRSVVEETNAMLANHATTDVSAIPATMVHQPLAKQASSSIVQAEPPKFRGSWLPRVANPTPAASFVPARVVRDQEQNSTEEAEAASVNVEVGEMNTTNIAMEQSQPSPPRLVGDESGESSLSFADTSLNMSMDDQQSASMPLHHRAIQQTVRSHQIEQAPTRRMVPNENHNQDVGGTNHYRVKTFEQAAGRGNAPGYMTPTESSKIRAKMTPTRPSTPTGQMHQPVSYPNSGRRTPTEPRAPNLATTRRARSNSGQLMNSEAKELEEIRQQRLHFQEERTRRQEFVHKVAHSSGPQVRPKPPTQPQPFPTIDRDTQKRLENLNQTKEFHSMAELTTVMYRRDYKPRALSSGDVHENMSRAPSPIPGGGHQKQPHTPVVPHAPQLRSSARSRPSAYKSSEEMELEKVRKEMEDIHRKREHNRVIMERSLNGSGLQHTVPAKPLTQPQPFELESIVRHERAQKELQEQTERQKLQEEEKRQFRAKPLPREILQTVTPLMERPASVGSSNYEPTVPVAPTCVERAMYAEQLRLNKIEQEARDLQRQREFHARQAPATTHKRPEPLMVPRTMEPTRPMPPVLRLEERAQKWAELEEARRQQEAQLEAERLEAERLEKQREEEELRDYRKGLVHQAKPAPSSSKFMNVYERAGGDEDFNQTIPHADRNQITLLSSARSTRGRGSLGGGAHRVMAPQPLDMT